MKRILTITLLTAIALASCKKEGYEYKGGQSDGVGTLSLADFSLNVTDDTDKIDTRTQGEAESNYMIIIRNSAGEVCYESTYGQIGDDSTISLPAGDYTFSAQSHPTPDRARFDNPVYGASKKFTITAGETANIGSLTCKLLQCKVTVGYDDNFLADVTGDCTTTVELTAGDALVYELTYDAENQKATYDQHAGYFPVNGGTTLEVTFKGMIEGKNQRMSKAINNIKAAQWRQIKFLKKIDEKGNATFDIAIDDLVEDQELGQNVSITEEIIGEDPNAPKGDGGIKLVSTCNYDIDKPVRIPELPAGYDDYGSGNYTPNFTLTMKAVVPAGVRSFTVNVTSQSTDGLDLPGALASMNDNSTTLDLVNPSEGAKTIFTTMIPFPYGNDVKNKDEILFDLTPAQAALRGFKGTHTFLMQVRDNNGCYNEIPVVMIVE